jgi:hypothetical protein
MIINAFCSFNLLKIKKGISSLIEGPVIYSGSPTVSVSAGWIAAGGGTQRVIKSSDGLNWSNVPVTTTDMGQFDGVAYGVDQTGVKKWVGIGSGQTQVTYSTNGGDTWLKGTPINIFGTYGRDVIYGKDWNNVPIWYGAGANAVPLAYSYDGINWVSKGTTLAGTNVLRGIAFGNNQYLALGNNGINLSTDFGNSWTNVSTLTSQGRDAAYGIDSNGIGRWIAVGSGSSIIAQSTNGSTWTAVPNASTHVTAGYAIAYGTNQLGNGLWVLGGTGAKKMVYTTDGITFTQCIGIANITTINGITCGKTPTGNSLWIAVGSGTDNILKSDDGITWTSLTNKTTLLSADGYCVTYGEDVYTKPAYLQYTPGSAILKGSIDGITYINLFSPFSISINKIKWNGTIWVGVGEGTNTIASSTNGIIWVGTGTSVFSIRGTNVEWNEVELKWYAYGEGTNTTVYSTDGLTWNSV